ncbi:MAG: alpha/beta fold hydrolase [Candidatus Acidiferrales bacterium]
MDEGCRAQRRRSSGTDVEDHKLLKRTVARFARQNPESYPEYPPMADVFHRNFFLAGPAGRLEAMLWTSSADDPAFAAVVCHPHPLFGGTMHNKVVYQAAKALHERGAPVLRFNFRGTGQSEGEHDKGRGEQDDVRAALDYLATEFPGKPIVLAGFSFGSWVGLRVGCDDARVDKLIGLGLPVDKTDMSFLRACAKPKLLIQGGNDQFGARANIEALYATLPEPKRLVIVDGVDHFFTGRLDQIGLAINGWLDA